MRLPLTVSVTLLCSALWSADDPAQVELHAVIKQLEEKAAQMKTDSQVQAYSVLMSAVKDLKKYIDDGDVDGSRLLVKLETPANMHKLFKAPSQIDKKTGQVTLIYDFVSSPTIVQDFTVGAATPSIAKGGILIPVAQSISHKATFIGNVSISGKVNTLNREGLHLSTSTGLRLFGSNYNAWFINLEGSGYTKTQSQFSKAYTETTDGNFIPFSLEISEKSLAAHWGEGTTGGTNPSAFLGSLVLNGGTGGDIYKDISITGTLDQNWIKQTLGIGAAP